MAIASQQQASVKERSDEQAMSRHDWNQLKGLVAEDVEKALLASVFAEPSLYAPLSQQVKSRDFFLVFHGLIWWAFGELDSTGQPLDTLSVETLLRERGRLSGEFASEKIVNIAMAYSDPLAVTGYVRKVTEYATRRRMLMVADKVTEHAYDTTVALEDAIDASTQALFVATERRDLLKNMHIAAGSSALWDLVEARHERGAPDGVSTGFRELDMRLDAIMPGELVMIGGDTGMGKTTLMLSIMYNMLRAGRTCVLFSLEMSQMEIAQNLTAMIARIPKSTLRRMLLTPDQMKAFMDAQGVISQLPLFVFGSDAYDDLTPLQFERQVRALQMQTQVDATFIDGLWLMSANVPSPEASYKNAQSITKDLIASAKKLNVPVVLMHQYASGYSARVQSTRREVKRPNIGDFADGRHATRNPHVVIGMHRPDLYGSADDDNVTEGLMQAFIIKNRNASGVDNEPVNLIFDKVTSSYREPRTRHVDLAE